MKCKQVSALLSSYLDGEVSSNERDAVEEHLKECLACSNLLNELEETIKLLRELEDEPVPLELAETIKASLRERQWAVASKQMAAKEQQQLWQRPMLKYLLVASGILAVIIAVAIPVRVYWLLLGATGVAPEQKTSARMQNEAERAPQRSSKGENNGDNSVAFDSVPEGGRVKETSSNYSKKGVDKLLDFHKEKVGEKESSEAFSAKERDETISLMIDEASKLALDASELARCLRSLVAQNENILPVYAEKTRFQGSEVWIVVVKDFSVAEKGFHIKALVLGAPDGEIIYSAE